MPDTRVLLLSNEAADAIAGPLERAGRSVTRTANASEAIALAPDHDVIVIDEVAPPRTVIDVCREIRTNPRLAELPILAISSGDDVEERIRLLEAGADDVVARPVDERELDARIEALDLRYRRAKELTPSAVMTPTRRAGRRLVVVFSPKGGVGTTTVAVNLALVLSARQSDPVALLDLAGGVGQVDAHLDLRPRSTLVDLLRDGHALEDPGAFTSYLTRHASGLRVLAASSTPLSILPPDVTSRLVDTALSAVSTVVVDAGSRLEPGTETLLTMADDLVLVVTPEYAALKAVRATFEHLAATNVGFPEPRVVLNELFAHEMLTPSDIQEALGRPVAVRVPYDMVAYQRAANEGRPVFVTAPRSGPGQRFELLGRVILGEDVPEDAIGDPRRRRLGLFGRA